MPNRMPNRFVNGNPTRRAWVFALAVLVLTVLVLGGGGCGSENAQLAEGEESVRVRAFPPVLLSTAEEGQRWEALWEHPGPDRQWHLGSVRFRSIRSATPADSFLAIKTLEGEGKVFFTFENARIDADRCLRLRIHGRNFGKAALWWARVGEAKSKGISYDLARLIPLKSTAGGGMFEADLSEHPSWTGEIVRLRLDFYEVADNLLLLQRIEGLLDESAGESILFSATNPDDVPLLAKGDIENDFGLISRMVVTDTFPQYSGSLAQLDRALERCSGRVGPGTVNVLTDLGVLLLANDYAGRAQYILSLAGRATTPSQNYLGRLEERLTPEQRQTLWSGHEPFLNLLNNGSFELWDTKRELPRGFRAPNARDGVVRRETQRVAQGTFALLQIWRGDDSDSLPLTRFQTSVVGLRPKTTYRLSVQANNLSQNSFVITAWSMPTRRDPGAKGPRKQTKIGDVITVVPAEGFIEYSGVFTTLEEPGVLVQLTAACMPGAEDFPANLIWDGWQLALVKPAQVPASQ